jgi:hypothetical protein
MRHPDVCTHTTKAMKHNIGADNHALPSTSTTSCPMKFSHLFLALTCSAVLLAGCAADHQHGSMAAQSVALLEPANGATVSSPFTVGTTTC